jgi:hypothetical protein
VSAIAAWIYKKELNRNLFAGLFALIAGSVLGDLKLFYSTFFMGEPLNRTIFAAGTDSLKQSFVNTVRYFVNGPIYHGPVVNSRFMLATKMVVIFVSVLLVLYRSSKKSAIASDAKLSFYSLALIACLVLAFLFSMCAEFYQNASANNLLEKYLPFVLGFNWGRFSFLNRTVIYCAFALALIMLISKKPLRPVAYFLAILQVVFVITTPSTYNYAEYNLNHAAYLRTDNTVTYNEFYAESLFAQIKTDLNYMGEGVASVGYHPSVLTYNGFSTVDGYNSCYPLSHMEAFREIIAPELDANETYRAYYDSWGGRMYLYNDELSYAPTRTQYNEPVELKINPKAFWNMGGRYILSRAEIGNAPELGLVLLDKYSGKDSIYQIFVYHVLMPA